MFTFLCNFILRREDNLSIEDLMPTCPLLRSSTNGLVFLQVIEKEKAAKKELREQGQEIPNEYARNLHFLAFFV